MRKNLKKYIPYLTFALVALVGYLLYQNLSSIEWDEVVKAIREISLLTAIMSLAIAGCIYFILASYDYLSFKYLGLAKNILYREVFPRAFVSYVMNLNLGSLVGGLALRYRVYSRWKIDLDRIPYIIAFSTLTNWLGYIFLLGVMITFRAHEVEKIIPVSLVWIRLAGVFALIITGFYFWGSVSRKNFHFRGEDWVFPAPLFSTLQLGMSTLQWSLQSVIIYLLLTHQGIEIAYTQILFTFMISSIAAVFTHIPAGLGVLEVIFLRMGLEIPESKLLVALIAYRVAYYLIPLVSSLPVLAYLEIKRNKSTH